MDSNLTAPSDEGALRVQNDLRPQIAARLLERRESVASDSVGIFQVSASSPLAGEYCRRVADLLVELLATAVREGRLDSRGGLFVELQRLVIDRALTTERLFTFAYLLERTVLDELALDDGFGATAEPWPLVAQLIRRASFDVLAAYTDRVQIEPTDAPLIDPLTTLYTWSMFETVLAKELERAGRFGYSISLILFDVDRFSDINREYGYGVGNLILERMGILIRKYFRLQDWVARHAEDAFAVLLVHADGDDAAGLAERARRTIEERLELRDHHTDREVHVTVSVAVVNVVFPVGAVLDPERLVLDALTALERAKTRGRNRVERLDIQAAAGP